MTERRYDADEVREIFGLATTGEAVGRPRVSDRAGLTLTDLQEIGREVGLEPARVQEAVAVLHARQAGTPRRPVLGLPARVDRIADLPRAPTNREWELLVAELRTTFGARGRVTSHGNLREWVNGNLHAYIEPTESGFRLRMATRKENALYVNVLGGAFLMFGAISAVAGSAAGSEPAAILFAATGLGAFAANLVRLPRWARKRDQQMAYIADWTRSLLELPPEGDTS
jgi:hypothetical protein